MIRKSMDDPSQRETIFLSKCLIKYNMCSLIIDTGSGANVASTTCVDLLKFPTANHAIPYKIRWLGEFGELRVHRHVEVKFKIGKYRDEILCDEVPMQACHVLLEYLGDVIIQPNMNGEETNINTC